MVAPHWAGYDPMARAEALGLIKVRAWMQAVVSRKSCLQSDCDKEVRPTNKTSEDFSYVEDEYMHSYIDEEYIGYLWRSRRRRTDRVVWMHVCRHGQELSLDLVSRR